MKPVSRAIPILLGFLVLCGVLFGNPQPCPALTTIISVGDTVTFEFDYSGVLPTSATPYPYNTINYGTALVNPGLLDSYSFTASWFDDLGSPALFSVTGSGVLSFGSGFGHVDPFLGLYDDPTSYMVLSLTGLVLASGATSASFDVTGHLNSAFGGSSLPATVSIATAPVPEPSTLLVVAPWVAWMGGMAWRRYRTSRDA